MKKYLYLILISCFSILMGCTGSKSLYKKGAQLEEQGLYNEAANFYYNSLLRNNNNIEARVALTNAGQRVLNDHLDDFSRARATENYKDAVYKYRSAMQYKEKLGALNVNCNVPDHYESDYKSAENVYLTTLYETGSELLASKEFDQANMRFKEIFALNPHFKDAEELKNISRNEPIYIAANEYFEKRLFRSAYNSYSQILVVDKNYKDVNLKMSECIELGKYTVAILPFDNSTNKKDIDKKMSAYLVNELVALNDPFLKIIERGSMDLILEEQRRNLSGMIDESSAVELGRLLGAKAIITGGVLSYSEIPGRLKFSEKKAFEAYQTSTYNAELDVNIPVTRYKPVEYREYYNSNTVKITFQYKMISMETGEILFADILEKDGKSDVYYATYEGEITSLYPATSDGVNTNKNDKQSLTNLLRANRKLEPIEQVATNTISGIADDVSNGIKSYLNTIEK